MNVITIAGAVALVFAGSVAAQEHRRRSGAQIAATASSTVPPAFPRFLLLSAQAQASPSSRLCRIDSKRFCYVDERAPLNTPCTCKGPNNTVLAGSIGY